MNSSKKDLSPKQRDELLRTLKTRFEKNMNRHKGLEWAKIEARLEANPDKLWSLHEMERTGGEPDVAGHDKKTGEYIFFDCSANQQRMMLMMDKRCIGILVTNLQNGAALLTMKNIGVKYPLHSIEVDLLLVKHL